MTEQEMLNENLTMEAIYEARDRFYEAKKDWPFLLIVANDSILRRDGDWNFHKALASVWESGRISGIREERAKKRARNSAISTIAENARTMLLQKKDFSPDDVIALCRVLKTDPSTLMKKPPRETAER